MCGLCGAFGQEHHWTARTDGATSDAPARRRERARRIAIVNRTLAEKRLVLREWHGASYVLASPTGGSEIVYNLGMVWLAVEQLSGGPFDPLEGLADDG